MYRAILTRLCVRDKKSDSRGEPPVGNRAFRGVRDKSEQMDVKKENSLTVGAKREGRTE